MDAGKILFAKYQDIYILKLVGDIRHTISSPLDKFLDDIFAKKDFVGILIDLTEVTGIDSTNLGLLAKIANFMRDNFKQKTIIVSNQEDINTILENVGFDKIFILVDKPECFGAQLEELPPIDYSEKSQAKMILDAHRTLMELNEKNRDMFKDVVTVLEKTLAEKDWEKHAWFRRYHEHR